MAWGLFDREGAAARRRLLPEGRLAGPMPWVIAIMMFLTVLAAAAGIALEQAARALGDALAGRVTVQLVEANAEKKGDAVTRIVAAARHMPGVTRISVVNERALTDQLRPWLGDDIAQADLPIPALIDVDLAEGNRVAHLQALRQAAHAISPMARVETHASFLAPVSSLVHILKWLAFALVLLTAAATGAVVVLAARGAHDSHRTTIETLHLMGATDVQIARLFQRRIALDALFGGAVGFLSALSVLLLLGMRGAAIGSEMLQSLSLPLYGWPLLLVLPLGGVLLAMLAARITVLRALRRSL